VKKIVHIVVAGGLLLGLWAARASGQESSVLESLAKKSSEGEGLGALLPLLLKGIGLTPEQGQRVKEIVASHREPLQTLFIQLQAANADLANKIIVADGIKAEDLAPQIQRITQLREQLLLEGLSAVLQVREVLTPEQRAKAVQLKNQIQSLGKTLGGTAEGKGTTPVAPEKNDPSATTQPQSSQ
jgi:Spy/CpxP family protein refolding chaperone